MIRTVALLPLALLLAGCSWFQSQRPLTTSNKELPPPYGSVAVNPPPKPVGNQSPLMIVSADAPPARPSDDPALIPPRSSALTPAAGLKPVGSSDPVVSAGVIPPSARLPEPDPQPDGLPSRVTAKSSPPASKAPSAAKAPSPVVPDPATPAAKNLANLKALVAASNAAWKAIDTYEAVVTRHELNPKGLMNNEVVFVQFRRDPMSVYCQNIGESGKGRETVYNPGKFEDKLYVKLGAGDPFPGAGFVAPGVSPDDTRVKAKARYSIRESGFVRTITALSAAVAKLEAGKVPPEAVTFDGEVKRDEFAFPLVGATHTLRTGDDALMPLGGTRHYFFDMRKDSPAYAMPVLVTATDPVGREVEYYLYEKIKQPANLTDANFDPARLSKK